ncbi:hypothetical protein MiYa_02360 [Microcystis aeruginosa NIES-2519]|uniref:Uncharacterized protein n=1 Tax=Microcystis aeruginosa NIES-2519 TaxID=2303981 RepID=A0A5A5R7J9_MICAE|nr:hypothetical protein MiYa_02360 [Microcystis aeruginosa NIES-2519]
MKTLRQTSIAIADYLPSKEPQRNDFFHHQPVSSFLIVCGSPKG